MESVSDVYDAGRDEFGPEVQPSDLDAAAVTNMSRPLDQ